MGTLNVGFDHLTTSNRFSMFVLLRYVTNNARVMELSFSAFLCYLERSC